MWWEGGCWTTISPLSCSGGTGDRGEGWLQARETGASRVGAPQPALPLHQMLLSLLAACPSLVCTPQLQSWPAPSLPREAQDKQAREKKGGGFEGRNYPSVLSPPQDAHSLSALPSLRYKRLRRGFISPSSQQAHEALLASQLSQSPDSLGASYTGAWAARTQEDATTPIPRLAGRDRR